MDKAEVEKFRKEHGIATDNKNTVSDHFLVQIMEIVQKNAELFADDRNQAFSQLRMGGKLEQIFSMQDETKEFALAYNYALHPLDELELELEELGIDTEIKVKKKRFEGGKDIEEIVTEKAPITFEVTLLKNFIDEWMRKRVPANRKRVKEFIDLVSPAIQEYKASMKPANTVPQEPGQRGRLF